MLDCNWIHYKDNNLLHWFNKIKFAHDSTLHLINVKKRYHFEITDTKATTFDVEIVEDITYEGEWKWKQFLVSMLKIHLNMMYNL